MSLPGVSRIARGMLSRQWVTGGLAVLLIALSLALAWQNERMAIAEQTRQLRVQSEILAAGVASSLAFDDTQTARQYLEAFRRNRDIRAAAIYNASGSRVLAFASGIGSPARVQRATLTLDRGELTVITPVSEGGLFLGWVYLRKTIEPFAARAGRYAPIGLVVLLAALLIGLLGTANAETTQSNLALQAQIAAREEAERALRQAQKMEALGQLTGGVAHDFNNILMAGLSGLELMGRAKTDERREALATAIRDTLKRGASLTQQLLTFARRTPVETEAVDIGEHLTSLGPMLRHSLRDGVNLTFDVPADIWPIEIDLSQFDIALLNLTVNARDAMPNGGEVRLSARNRAAALHGADAVEITLEDQGSGMSSEALEKAFEPFFTTKERGRGTGLGLAQVYGFASASGGEVRLESRPGEGTKVTLLLKRAVLGPAREVDAVRSP